MKIKMAAALLAAALCTQVGSAAFAEDEQGPWTKDHPYAWGVASLPFRATTTGVGLAFGSLAGSAKGIVETEQKFAEHTWGEADKNPLMVPVGLVGSVVAIPVGVVMGLPQGAAKGAAAGYKWWDRF